MIHTWHLQCAQFGVSLASESFAPGGSRLPPATLFARLTIASYVGLLPDVGAFRLTEAYIAGVCFPAFVSQANTDENGELIFIPVSI